MKGKLGRYLDLDEDLALGATIAWHPGFTHHITWAALWDFVTRRFDFRIPFGTDRSPSRDRRCSAFVIAHRAALGLLR